MSGDLISTLESPGEFDALSKLRPDEPFFPLLGRDRLAPPLVQEWADNNRKRALAEFADGKIDEERRDRELRKSTQAEATGWAMISYKAGDLAKKAIGEPTAKSYTGHDLPEETKLRDAIQSARARAASAVNNAVSELVELELLIAGGEESVGLAHAIGDLKRLSDKVAPSRISPGAAPLLEQANG